MTTSYLVETENGEKTAVYPEARAEVNGNTYIYFETDEPIYCESMADECYYFVLLQDKEGIKTVHTGFSDSYCVSDEEPVFDSYELWKLFNLVDLEDHTEFAAEEFREMEEEFEEQQGELPEDGTTYILADLQDLDDTREMTLYEAKEWLIEMWWDDWNQGHWTDKEYEEFKATVRARRTAADLNENLAGIDYSLFESLEEIEEFKEA